MYFKIDRKVNFVIGYENSLRYYNNLEDLLENEFSGEFDNIIDLRKFINNLDKKGSYWRFIFIELI